MKLASLNDLTCPFHKTVSLELTIHEYNQNLSNIPIISTSKFCSKYCVVDHLSDFKQKNVIKDCSKCFKVEINFGKLICPECKREFFILDGIPSFFTKSHERKEGDVVTLIKQFKKTQDDRYLRAYYESEIYLMQYLDLTGKKLLSLVGQRKFDIITKKFLQNLNEDMVILDIGVGGGNYVNYFRSKRISKVWACDISLPLLQQISKLYPEIFVVHCDAAQLPFKNEIFDCILCLDVLEHVKKPKKSISNSFNILKKGKPLIISLPNLYNYDVLEAYFRFQTAFVKIFNLIRKIAKKPAFEFIDRHLNKYKIGNWRRITRKIGFRIIKTYGYFLIPSVLIPGNLIPLHKLETIIFKSWFVRKILFYFEDRLFYQSPFSFLGQGIIFLCVKAN